MRASRLVWTLTAALALLASSTSTPVAAAAPPPPRTVAAACSIPGGFEDGFGDVSAENPHETAVDCIVYWQITGGLRPGVYNPFGDVTRGQMASFVARLIKQSGFPLPAAPPDAFTDDETSTHENDINKVAALGVVGGRADGSFAPKAVVTRGQMATFIVRALELVLGEPLNATTAEDYFTDDAGDVHEENINKAAAEGIASGLGGTEYGPGQPVRRAQMGSFLARSLAELVDRISIQLPPRPAKCSLDPGLEKTDARCRPCPYDASIGSSNPACKPPPPPPTPVSFGDGTYRVNVQIPPGTYRTRAPVSGCYWERLSGFSGGLDDVLANEFSNDHQVVTISGSDAGFKTDGCGTWSNNLSPMTLSPMAPFGSGTWIVNTDLAPGTWSAPGGSGCYWERLSGFSGNLDDIISNDFGSANVVVTIAPSDRGFASGDCGTWTRS